MKKLAILAIVMIAPMLLSAQGAFDSYEGENDVTTIVMTKNLFRIMAKADVQTDDPDVKKYMNMIEGLESVKIFITENVAIGARMKSDVTRYVSASNGLDELMRITNEDANVKFYSRQGATESQIKELLLFVEGEMDDKQGTIIASITGDIDLKHLSRLTKDLSLPASDFAISPNPATDRITIRSKDKSISSVVIYEGAGKVVFSEENLDTTNKQINVSSFSKGLYLVSVNNEVSQKVLKN